MPEPVIPQIPKEDLDQDLRQVFDTGIERTGDATICLLYTSPSPRD